ncbi:MAG: histidinol-phosphate transaminase [Candidatus Omnitrophota bacterium]
MPLIRKDIDSIDAYKPGKPIEEVRRELGLKSVIKLASNENSLGSSPKALAAIRKTLGHLNRYPEGNCPELRKQLAGALKIRENNLLMGNGSDELLDIILKAVKEPEAEIVTADITFIEYRISALVNGFKVTQAPLKDFTYDLEAIAKCITPKTKAVFIANPNNPTGTYVTARDVTAFLNRIPEEVLVVFDEAYLEFVEEKDFPDTLALLSKKNIVILRTFSKIYGLAGLRIGYMIAAEDFIEACQKIRQPFNVNSLAQAAARAALTDKVFVRRSQALIHKEKKFLCDAFSELGIWFKKSAANFIFIKTQRDARELFAELLKKGVIIREMSQYGLNNYSRVTIGTRRENTLLIQSLRTLKGGF